MPTLPTLAPAVGLGPTFDLEAAAVRAAGLAEEARAPATRRAYRFDWDHFTGWCAAQRLDPLPASPAVIGLYVAAHADALSVATLSRRIASIATAHRLAGHSFDTRHPGIAAVMRGLRRTKGSAQRRAEALTVPRLRQVLVGFGDRLADHRDRALLLVGTAAALRRSELVALEVADIRSEPEGLRITIRRSKADQEGKGVVLAVGRTGRPTCPARAYERWIAEAAIAEGPAFRAIDRHGRLGGRLSGNAVAELVKRRVAAAGLDPAAYSGHSLRSGFATSAARAGVGEIAIARQTRHASLNVLRRYVRDGRLFDEALTEEIGL